jgi:NhaA family Na+:H+ antiporter
MSRVARFLPDSIWALPIGAAIALAWANALPESYYQFAHASRFVVNDVGLTFFLGIVMKEVFGATLPGGPLHTWRKVALPLAASVGGAGASIAVFLLYLNTVGDRMLTAAWITPCAVDIASVYVVGRLIFGRHAGVSFLLVLAIAMNTIGLVALAVFGPIDDAHAASGIGLMALALVTAFALRRTHVTSFWWYLLGPGVLSWWALYLSGVHPALALMPIIPFMPHTPREAGLFVDPAPQVHDTLTMFERWWARPVEGILLLFGLVNAGVPLSGFEEGWWALPVAVLIGRPLGILVASALAVGAGLHLPKHVGWREVAVIGCLSSIGLMMALFFASATMAIGPLLQELKVGALLTAVGAVVALGAARLLHVGRFAR